MKTLKISGFQGKIGQFEKNFCQNNAKIMRHLEKKSLLFPICQGLLAFQRGQIPLSTFSFAKISLENLKKKKNPTKIIVRLTRERERQKEDKKELFFNEFEGEKKKKKSLIFPAQSTYFRN